MKLGKRNENFVHKSYALGGALNGTSKEAGEKSLLY